MGCDIHGWVEVKHHGVQSFDYKVVDINFINRNYTIFGYLFGVRGDCEHPIAPKRGLPSNVSSYVAEESEDYGTDGHSHSWISLKEINNALLKEEIEFTSDWQLLFSLMEKLGNYYGEDNVRLVVWFDN